MTHPTREQERAAEERLRALVKIEPINYPIFDDWIGGNHGTYGDLAILLSVVERQREALESAKSVLATRCASIKDHTNSEIVTLKKICAALGESNDA